MRIAIVGSGVSGLVAAHLLARRHEVHVLEADDRIGGHTHTRDVELGGRSFAADTGFIVFNDWTYPNFIRLLERLGVESQPSDMSFSVRNASSGVEYNGTNLNALFAQRRNLLRPSFWSMVRGIMRFNASAPRLLEGSLARDNSASEDRGGAGEPGDGGGPTLGRYLAEEGCSESFVRDYILPMGGAIWSASTEQMLEFPARYFVRFFLNHGMLSVNERPQWRVVKGGSRSYLDPLTESFADRIRLGARVESVARDDRGVELSVAGAPPERFDTVVLAAHSDQSLQMLTDPSQPEREVLGAIRYQPNTAVLHTDINVMPRSRRAWAAWNYHLDASQHEVEQGGPQPVAVTYWMNKLQCLDAPEELLVTLNRDAEIDRARVLEKVDYSHPVFDAEAVAAQARWSEISGQRRTWYCGAYWSSGFHEDGVASGMRVARGLGVEA